MQASTFTRALSRFAFAATIALAASVASAQAWPSKPITIVSPYPAGGITDLLSRIVGEELSKALGQPVVVENRTGAGGAIALATVAKAAPDGYTLVMGGSAPSAIVPALNRNITYGPKDFEAIGYVAGLPIVLVAHSSIPAANLNEFLAYVRANSGKLNCGHHGIGTGTHLACVQFAQMTGTKITDIAYKGAPQVNADLLANRVQLYFATLPTQLQYVRAGQMKAYGVASPERAPSAPEIPTLEEQGLKGLNLDSWNALYAPAGTPKPIVQRLNTELVKILNIAEVKKRIEGTGSIVRPGTAEQLHKLTADEFVHYRKLAADANIRME
ncbi:MAG: tripartite tricarboxylate transporter substrate binding protein [Betaproteobacteria bacterium]|nr:tripartite tricarboxylate transporter substrate binding protein [Betaproteobacteria bacterium]